jgi:protein-S-isoprenylcysteine O-methyltransferase Ste14
VASFFAALHRNLKEKKMTVSSKQLHRSQRRDALIYWIYIPSAVVLGGKTVDRLLDLPSIPSFGRLPVIPAAILIGIGVVLIQRASFDLKHYGGGTPNPQAPPERLVTEGSFSLCRHPMFLGYDLTALGTVLLLRSWGMLIIAYPVFIALEIRFLQNREEPVLARRFGAAYSDYRKRIPFLLPNPFKRRKPS